ncbi:nuclear transport factor 2 family protein [Agaribacterium sp. ZY112]|uniref:nuclear transport factor 2 family protein n=1 Tax=Agaribacterium sp. ZY112 TaxID=3233574 RepID=UPI0035235D8D
MRDALQNYVLVLEGLEQTKLAELEVLLDDSVEFLDPFNHTNSKAEMMAIMSHMFRSLSQVNFACDTLAIDDKLACIKWTYSAHHHLLGDIKFVGMSRIECNDSGLIISHQDYWDSSLVYKKLPLLGRFFIMLKRRFKAKLI